MSEHWVEKGRKPCLEGCGGHGGRGVCPHCVDWHADDFSCCDGPTFDPVSPLGQATGEMTA